MDRPKIEKGGISQVIQEGAKLAGRAATVAGGLALAPVSPALAARIATASPGGAAAPEVAAPAPGPTGGAADGEQMTRPQAKLNAKVQRTANKLGWLAAGVNTSERVVNFVPAVGGGMLAQTTTSVNAGNRADSNTGEYSFTVLSAASVDTTAISGYKPDYNRTQQVIVSEGPAGDAEPYAQLTFYKNPKTQTWVVEGDYNGPGGTTIEAAVWPHAGTREAQLTTAQFGSVADQAGGLIRDARFTTPPPVGHEYQAFAQPGGSQLLEIG